jgi:hypothetical protein
VLLQEVFVEALFQELRWSPTKDRVKSESQLYTKLQLKKVQSGSLWIGKSTVVSDKTSNPVSIWLANFRAEIAEQAKAWTVAEDDEDAQDPLSEMIDSYITKIDPLMKGVLSEEDVASLDSSAQEDLGEIGDAIKNERGEVDFFRFL